MSTMGTNDEQKVEAFKAIRTSRQSATASRLSSPVSGLATALRVNVAAEIARWRACMLTRSSGDSDSVVSQQCQTADGESLIPWHGLCGTSCASRTEHTKPPKLSLYYSGYNRGAEYNSAQVQLSVH
jgi:hypothetical protein